jgi:FixJ family two-component response regulator
MDRYTDSEAADHAPVLVVEGQDSVRRLLTRLLERDGLSALEFESPARAAHVRRAPRLLIADNSLPGQSGYLLADTLRRRFAGLPVLLVARAGDTVVPTMTGDGPVALLNKPFFAEQFRDAVRALLSPDVATAPT